MYVCIYIHCTHIQVRVPRYIRHVNHYIFYGVSKLYIVIDPTPDSAGEWRVNAKYVIRPLWYRV